VVEATIVIFRFTFIGGTPKHKLKRPRTRQHGTAQEAP
jgi:hypothetical protein